MTPIELTQRLLALANAMDRLAVDLQGVGGYEVEILRHQLSNSASALRSRQVTIAAELAT